MQEGSGVQARTGVDDALEALALPVHRPAPGEWGVTVPAGAWPLQVGLRIAGGILRVQTEIAPPGVIDPAWLLHRNRRDLLLVRYATSSYGAVWVHGDLPIEAASAARVDELLGRLLQAAEDAREVAVWPPPTG
jgi:hypothetical protein